MSQVIERQDSAPKGEEPEEPRRPSKRRRAAMIGLPILAIAIAAGLLHYFAYARYWESTDDAFIESHIIQISPQVAGFVKSVAVDDNQRVETGQLLVQIDPRDFQAKVEQAHAVLAATTQGVDLTRTTAGAGVSQAESGVQVAKSAAQTAQAAVGAARSQQAQAEAQLNFAQASVGQAQAEVGVAEAEVTRSSTELKRILGLASSGTASPQELTNAQSAARANDARLEAAKKKAAATEAQVVQARANGAGGGRCAQAG